MRISRSLLTLAGLALALALPGVGSAAPVSAGTTTVTFNPTTLSTLTGAGFAISPVAPATLSTTPSVSAAFPITGGDTTTTINHSGGLTLTRNGTAATLQNFQINLNTATLLGQVLAGGATQNNVPLFDITMSNGTTNLALDATLAGAINQVFGVALPTGTPIGTAVVSPAAVPEPGTMALAGLAFVSGLAYVRRRASRA